MTNRGRGDIRRLAAASAISGTGDWAASTALALAVYAKTGSVALGLSPWWPGGRPNPGRSRTRARPDRACNPLRS
jgi:hypothetical protein